MEIKKIRMKRIFKILAPRVGFEPTTLRLTAGCSAVELPRNFFGALRFLGARKYYRHFDFRRNPLFQNFFQQPISGAAVDSQPHPNTSISLSNSTGHVRLSLKLQSAAPGEQGTEVCSRFNFALPATYYVNTPPSPVHPVHVRRSATRRKRHAGHSHRAAPQGPSKSRTRSTTARSRRSSARAIRT